MRSLMPKMAPGQCNAGPRELHRVFGLVFEGSLKIDSALYNFLGSPVIFWIWFHLSRLILKHEVYLIRPAGPRFGPAPRWPLRTYAKLPHSHEGGCRTLGPGSLFA
jgi:hypothetical protein